MTQQELHRLARLGAEARLQQLQREIQSIYAAFPDLRPSGSAHDSTAARVGNNGSAAEPARKQRRRRKMSAEARKRIGDAQRKRWAEVRAKRSEAEGAAGTASTSQGAQSRKKR